MASLGAGRDPPAGGNLKHGVKPVIQELIRTQVCLSPLRLLLDKLAVVPVLTEGKSQEAYRLWMTDGEKSIQALIRRELHPFLTSGDIHEGSYVFVDDYELLQLPRQAGKGHVWVLAIKNLEAIGSDGRELPYPALKTLPGLPGLGSEGNQKSRRRPSTDSDSDENSKPEIEIQYESDDMKTAKAPWVQDKRSDSGDPESEAIESPQKQKQKDNSDNVGPDGYWSENREPDAKRHKSEQDHHRLQELGDTPGDVPDKPAPTTTSKTFKLRQIQNPLKITPLSRLTGQYSSRNKVQDVLAVVCAVDKDVISRRGMPDQRKIWITDTSTTKHVELTVFVNAGDFTPKVGTIALFRNVTTHEWNGGSLKAYQRDCAGRQWFFPNPTGVDENKLKRLKAHWDQLANGLDGTDGKVDGQ